jgi:predicted metalloprotease
MANGRGGSSIQVRPCVSDFRRLSERDALSSSIDRIGTRPASGSDMGMPSLRGGGFFRFLVLTGAACSSPAASSDISEDENDWSVERRGTGPCDALHVARASAPMFSQSTCEPPNAFALAMIRELFILWNTQPRTVCAFSTPIQTGCGSVPMRNAAYCSTDDAIVWDQPFLQQRAETAGDFAVVAMMAHEWGHLNQEKVGLGIELRAQRMGDERLAVLSNELHADCEAGLFTAVQELQGHLDVGDAKEAFDLFCRAGDPPFAFLPHPHGTCEQRAEAFLHGYFAVMREQNAVCSADAAAATARLCSRW